MQKLITLTIDISSLQSQAAGPFSLSEIDAVGELLAAGWAIESWEFVTGDQERTKAVIMMLLNDGMDGSGYEDSYYELDEAAFMEDDEDEAAEDEAPQSQEENGERNN